VIAPARRAALNVLMAVDAGRADLPAALAAERARLADDRDRALAAELSIGTLRWQGEIDHVTAAASKRPLERLDRAVLNILRLAVYQLLHLDRVPVAAVVDDAVDQTRSVGKSSAAGFVNGVLRSIVRTRHAPPLPPRPSHITARTERDEAEALTYLSVSLSHPRWLVERWLARWGFDEVESWLRFNNSEAPLTVRTNTLRVDRDELSRRFAAHGVTTIPTTWSPDGLIVMDGNPLRTNLADSGLFVVQDEASQLVPLLAHAQPGTRILDACAAPGGKTIALAAASAGRAAIVANDVRPRRIALLRRAIAQAGVPNVVVVRADIEQPLPFGAVFDVVLLDAPCSGLGILRRDPEIRWRRRPADLPVLAEAQKRMLRHVAAVVKPGGRVVYATCSSELEENEAVVAHFAHEDHRFRPWSAIEVRSWLPAHAHELVNEQGFLRTWPFRHGLEAFFGAVLIREG
jgi:16S rRNA (cytosine967-C5)-methyltransferase